MSKTDYFQKLKDPRWQKKRLEIMERQNFSCEFCGEEKETLHVHHKRYIRGLEPWEYEENDLLCLCETCHDRTHALKEKLDKIISYNYTPIQPYAIDILIGYLKGMLVDNRAYRVKMVNEHESRGFADYFHIPLKQILERMVKDDFVDGENITLLSKKTKRKKKV